MFELIVVVVFLAILILTGFTLAGMVMASVLGIGLLLLGGLFSLFWTCLPWLLLILLAMALWDWWHEKNRVRRF